MSRACATAQQFGAVGKAPVLSTPQTQAEGHIARCRGSNKMAGSLKNQQTLISRLQAASRTHNRRW